MTKLTRLVAAALFCAAAAMPQPLAAAVTQRFTVETSQIRPVTIRAYHGETLSIEATLTSYGQPVTNVTTASFLWQTNGMDTAWWQTNATVTAGVARAVFAPSMDVGNDRVLFFFALSDSTGGSYRPAGTIAFTRSPGANPTTATLPDPGGTLDFSTVTVLNAPWCTLEAAQSAVSTGLNTALNAVATLSNSVSTTITSATNAVLTAAAQSAAATYQPIVSMSSYALKTEIPTVPSLDNYATKVYATNAANTARLAAEQSAAATYQPIASMSSYATKDELASAVIGAGSSDYTLRLLSTDGSRFQTADGSIYQITIAPATTNWYWRAWPDDLLTNISSTVWFWGDPELIQAYYRITYSATDEKWSLSATGVTYEANPAEKFAATNLTFHCTSSTSYADETYIRLIIPAHPVTNKVDQVLYESTGSQGDLIAATNATLNAAKAYTDASITGAGTVSPQVVTNISSAVTTNVVNEDFLSNLNWAPSFLRYDSDESLMKVDGVWTIVSILGNQSGAIATRPDLTAATNAVNQSIATLSTQVSTIGAHLNAEDARFVATNYNSSTHLPEAYVEIKLTNSTWSTIWREMTRWNKFLGTNWNWQASSWSGFSSWSESLEDELANKADRAWGYYDSHTGNYAPDGYTWISSPKIAIAGGLAYQRTVTSEGAIWVLESNGLVTQTGGETNGYFRITDEEGNTQFEIVKGDKRTIGADATNVTVLAGYTPTKMQIGYNIQSDTHPTIEVCSSLTNLNWKAETDADCLANVTWTGYSGAWVATVQGKTAQPSLFVQATYQAGGETYINNTAPVALTHLYLGGVKYAVGTNTISGKLVLTLTPSN